MLTFIPALKAFLNARNSLIKDLNSHKLIVYLGYIE
jgi:hypothetical protein